MAWDVVVVGAGLGGLLTAVHAAGSGARVLVVEGAAAPGGRAGTDQVVGHAFDRGAHAVFLGGALDQALQALGGMPVPVPVPLSGVAALVDGALWDVSPSGLVRAPWLSWRERMALGSWLGATWVGSAPQGTASAALAARLPPGRALDFARMLTCINTYTGALDRLPASAAWAQVGGGTRRGVAYMPGGWQSIVDALVDRLRGLGGELQTGTGVRRAWRGGVAMDTGEVSARDVVLAVPPSVAARLTGRALPGGLPVHVGSLQVALHGEVVPIRPRAVIALDCPVFLSNFSAVVPLGGAETAVVHLTHYAGGARARDDVDGVLECWAPRWREGLVAQRWLPRMCSRARLPHEAVAVDALGAGLWLVGDAYGRGHHLADAAAASAATVAQALRGVAGLAA